MATRIKESVSCFSFKQYTKWLRREKIVEIVNIYINQSLIV